MSSLASSPFRALTHYRELPSILGWRIMVIAAVARAPFAMLPLGILTAFTASTGDIAVGGMATAFFSISIAICSPLIGRASDIWGQRLTLLTLIPINAFAILGLYWAAVTSQSAPIVAMLCLFTGATVVPVGSFTRARWVSSTSTPRLLYAAFSYESMADEFVFVLGPALVGIAASASAPTAPLLVAFALALLAGIPFALTAPRTTVLDLRGEGLRNSTANEDRLGRPRIRNVIASVIPAIIALIGVGAFFGSVQTATTARAEFAGVASQAGLIYAVMGIGSALAALLVVVLPSRFKLSMRLLVFGLGMATAISLVAITHSLGLTTAGLAIAGIFVGPTLVTAFSLAEILAPKGGISVAMTLMSSAVTIGVSVGAAVGGAIAENMGDSAAFFTATTASLLIIAVGIALRLPAYRHRHRLI